MILFTIGELRILNGQSATDSRISVGSALLILRKNEQTPHKLSATSRYPTDVPPPFLGRSILFPGTRKGVKGEDQDASRYAFPLWTREKGLIWVPRWCDITDNELVAVSEPGSNQAGGFPGDWVQIWQDGGTVSSTSVKDVR